MKKIIPFLMLTFLFISANDASAQFRLGVKGGFDFADNPIETNILKVSNRIGYQIGGVAELLVPASGFGGDVAILYSRKEYEVQSSVIDGRITNYDYISIPINIKQRIKFGPALPIGIFVSGGVYGNVKIEGSDFVENIENAVDQYESKNFSFGVAAGAGVNLFKRFDIGVYFRGELTERYGYEYMDADTFQNKKFQTWSLGLSYYF